MVQERTREQRIQVAAGRLARAPQFAAVLRNPDTRAQAQQEMRALAEAVIDGATDEPGVIRKSLETAWEATKGAALNTVMLFGVTSGMKYVGRHVRVGSINGAEIFGFDVDERTRQVTVASGGEAEVMNVLRNPQSLPDNLRPIVENATRNKTGAELAQALDELKNNEALRGVLAEARTRGEARATEALNYARNNPLEYSITSTLPLTAIGGGLGLTMGLKPAWDRVSLKYALRKKAKEIIQASERTGGGEAAHGLGADDDIQVPNVPRIRGGRQQQPQYT